MVKSSPGINTSRDLEFRQQPGNPLRQDGVAWGGVGDVVGFLRKAIVIVEYGRILSAQQCCRAFLPVRADDKDGIPFCELRWKARHEIHHRLVAGVSQDWQ